MGAGTLCAADSCQRRDVRRREPPTSRRDCIISLVSRQFRLPSGLAGNDAIDVADVADEDRFDFCHLIELADIRHIVS